MSESLAIAQQGAKSTAAERKARLAEVDRTLSLIATLEKASQDLAPNARAAGRVPAGAAAAPVPSARRTTG